MDLPIVPPFLPMEAELVDEMPAGDGWQFEPKWDGFRCLAFKDGADVYLQSKSGRPLGRYFPDVVALVAGLPPRRLVLDGELVVPIDGHLSFDELQLRLHPAASRVEKLAAAHPARYLAFDLLVTERGRSLVAEPLVARRAALEQLFARLCSTGDGILLSEATRDRRRAEGWLADLGGSLDGVMAKQVDAPYVSGERGAMRKVKRIRTADCVIGGFRWRVPSQEVGSLLLGLYDDEGLLQHVGFTSSLERAERERFTAELVPLLRGPADQRGFTGRAPGAPSRWSRGKEKSLEWEAVRPRLVVEVTYDHFTGGRFRHGTGFLRRRPDKPPAACRFDQIPRAGKLTLAQG